MNICSQMKFTLLGVAILLVIAHKLVLSAPIGSDIRQAPDSPSIRTARDMAQSNGSKDDICVNKGKFCEIICKNNPSEGGKMCK